MAKIPASDRGGKRAGAKRRGRAASRRPVKSVEKRVARTRRQRKLPAIEAVMAAFAHDVRTPLTGILALSELLATSELDERERRWVAAIKDAAQHVAELTTLIVEGARAGTGRLPPRNEVFDLPRFAAGLAATFAVRAEAKNLDCEIDIAADLPQHARGDAAQLRTALENLMANAVKFTERGKVGLAVACTALARNKLRIDITISDSGIGMTAAEIKRLFRPFAQANPDIARKFGGAGLGLVQVRRLARAMHGDLTVASTPERGSTFHLRVVVERAEPDASGTLAPSTNDEGQPAGRALDVLCVEDNPFARVVMNAILTELGHRVDFAGSGEAAVAAATSKRFDVVLMDVALAGLDGLEATRRIRAPSGAAPVPVIGVSGRAGTAAADAALAAGMQAYLTKPVSPRMLADALAKVRGTSAE